MRTEVTKRFRFEAAHRLPDHKGKCRYYHGHTYTVEVRLAADTLDEGGMVVDFGVLKEKVGTWVDANWDHAMLLRRNDPLGEWLILHSMKVFLFDESPTAEIMASHLFDVARGMNTARVEVVALTIWETPDSYATVRC